MHDIDTHSRLRRQPRTTRNPFLTASDEAARHSAVLSTEIGLGRVRKAVAGVIDLWDVSPPIFRDGKRWDGIFRAWLAELEEAVR